MKHYYKLLTFLIGFLLFTIVSQETVKGAENTIYLKSTEDERGYSVDLPSTVYDNKRVKRIVLPADAEYIMSDYRYETDKGIVQHYKSLTPNCPNLSQIEVNSENPYFTVVDNILYSKDLKKLYYCPPELTGDVVLPSQVEKIGYMAFQGCGNITSITFSEALNEISDAAFGENKDLKIVKIPKENQNFKVESNVLLSQDGELLYLYPSGIEQVEYTISDGVRRIVPGSFLGNNYLKKVSIPDSVTSIGIEAFRNCRNLEKVTLQEGLLEIEAGAFLDCSNIKEMVFPKGILNIYNSAIKGCDKLLTITLPESIQEVPNDLANVENRTIYCYSLFRNEWLVDIEATVKENKTVVYLYKGSRAEQFIKNKNITVKYLKPKASTSKNKTKIKKSVVKGKGTPDSTWYTDKKSNFIISTPDQLAGLAQLVNKGNRMSGKNFVLQKDIDLSCYENWKPIGMYTSEKYRRFSGIFDGNGHTIFNLKINRVSDYEVGLFGIMEGTIKNLNIENADVLGYMGVGILCGSLNMGTIKNCKISGIVTGSESVGGLAGVAYGEIKNCRTNVLVRGTKNAGGILGRGNCSVTDSSVKGKVFCSDTAGGISGSNTGEMISCKNYAAIHGNKNIGGISGELLSNYEKKGEIRNSINYALAEGTENIGGIVGFCENGITLKECKNKGEVMGNYFVGGIAGYSETKEISDSKNYGKVSGISSIGGIIGVIDNHSVEENPVNCRNDGTIVGKQYFGNLYGKKKE